VPRCTSSDRRSRERSANRRTGSLALPVVRLSSAQASDQFLERERLDEVVIRPGFEPGDAVGDGIARGQDQDRDAVPGRPQRATDLDAVASGHEHVEDDGVEGRAVDCLERLRPVVCELDVVAVRPQRAVERFANRIVVVDDEDVHLVSISNQVKRP
jgi:hypothetical protein